MGTIELKLDASKHIIDICAELQNAGYETYVVGGAVRDFLINKVPKDYDLSTSATPDDIRRVFGRKRARLIGRRFRLVHLRHGTEIIEISTFRKIPSKIAQDVRIKHKLGNAPDNMIFCDNEFGTSEEDAWRRDFTINALFYDPVARKLVDHTGQGVDDVKNRLVRAIGNPAVRFEEDPVRILRALKFAGQCDMTLEAETEKALIKAVPLIRLAAPSRLTLELEKILKNPYSHKILSMFRKYGFLEYFLPELNAQWDSPAGEEVIKFLEIRNSRIATGKYRDSISVGLVLTMLPLIEKTYGALDSGAKWFANRSRAEFSEEVYYMIKDFYAPHALIKALLFSAQRTFVLLPELLNEDYIKKASNKPGYPHAREVMLVINQARGLNKSLENILPEKEEVHAAQNHKKRPRRRKHRPPHKPKE